MEPGRQCAPAPTVMYKQRLPLAVVTYGDKYLGDVEEDTEKKAFIERVLIANGVHYETIVAMGHK